LGSKYTEFLSETAEKLGFQNIGILTDFDSQGIGIALDYGVELIRLAKLSRTLT
jgi:hypothetical protein